MDEYNEKTVAVTICRKKKIIAAPMTAKVTIDGEEAGQLKNGESIVVNVEPGRHIIFINVNGEKKCGGIFETVSSEVTIVTAALMHGWNMYLLGAVSVPRSEFKKEQPEDNDDESSGNVLNMTPTQRQIYIAKYGKRAFKKAVMDQLEKENEN